MSAHMTTPCENCPYRKDAPLRLWHKSEFQKLLASDSDRLGKTYSCHKQGNLPPAERGFCAGWLLDQKRRNVPSIVLRVILGRDIEARQAFEQVSAGGHELYKTVKAMCRANGVRPQ